MSIRINSLVNYFESQVKMSQKTKFFVDLLQKNYLVVDKIKHIAMENFNQNDESNKVPIFVTNKKE